MFEFLKRLVTRRANVVITGFEEPEVAFTCDHELPMGLRDVVADVAGEKILARFDVVEIGEQGYRGTLVAPQEMVAFLKEIFAPYHEKRQSVRLDRNLRVISKDLPGFKGTSRDLSLTGMRVEVQAPVPVGAKLELQLDLDDAQATTLQLKGETRWCAPKVNTPFSFIGLHFLDLTQSDKAALRRFLETLQQRLARGALELD